MSIIDIQCNTVSYSTAALAASAGYFSEGSSHTQIKIRTTLLTSTFRFNRKLFIYWPKNWHVTCCNVALNITNVNKFYVLFKHIYVCLYYSRGCGQIWYGVLRTKSVEKIWVSSVNDSVKVQGKFRYVTNLHL